MEWRSRVFGVPAVMLMLAAACGSGDGGAAIDGQQAADASTTVTTATTTIRSTTTTATTTATPTTTTPPSGCDPDGVDTTTQPVPTTDAETTATTTTEPAGADNQVATQQELLTDLGYWLGEVDGKMGSNTAHAVTAFQKTEGLERTGELDAVTVERLADATRPGARTGSGTLLEVDLQRQVLFAVVDGTVRWIFDIATGASATPTPAGQYEIYNEIDGFRHAPLGTLYRPKYFTGGIAFHGYTSVPAYPASHGCVRLTYPAIDFLWDTDLAPIGSTVSVY